MRFFLILALLYIGFVLVKGLAGYLFLSNQQRKRAESEREKMVQDPVCEIYLPRDRAVQESGEKGPVYFCSEKCRKAYRGKPIREEKGYN